jgi:hypothetical protein
MTLEEFIERDNFGENLSNLDQVIYQYMQQKVTQMQALAPERTGDLKRSIQLTADRFSFKILMNYYGVFQNYGVMGTDRSRSIFEVEEGWTIGGQPVPTREMQFGVIDHPGISARSFINLSEITNELKELIKNNI